ncbi:DUF1801 domain-containing protein [Limimaricola hongkongensis]|uniref:YdhG-like domain-containing protein n=1 Tax=Limimaricola hongkongensis DSM 17492 TaxID=1122180 RepID=A0A017HEH2_9RHOB|nr:DUF1801 domain-containing protein [Limimaricola hongkongensis]EYD72184.1 hypothetical protein Lokhon_00975 [Limimaricola hongkongensis DSM 17492]
MPENKTMPTGASVSAFLDAVTPERKREDAQALDALFREVTGYVPQMWGPSIVGYGAYDYVYDSGRTGRFLATGFSPRKANLVLYIMPGYDAANPILDRLGKHRLGKSCLYINKLADVDRGVLAQLIRHGLDRLAGYWPVHPI